MKKSLLYVTGVFIAGCSSNTIDEPQTQPLIEENLSKQELLINPESTSLDEIEATNVATLFQQNGFPNRSRGINSLSVPRTKEVTDENSGDALFYVINWPADGGFVVVSSTKNTSPVLAFSEEGYFDLNERTDIHSLFVIMKEHVKIAKNVTTDSLRREHALEWAMYEMPTDGEPLAASRATSAETERIISTKIAKMQSKGYKYCGKLSWAANYLTAKEYQALCRDIESQGDPQYDYMETTLCFTKDQYDASYGPLLATTPKWHQGDPYNSVPVLKELGLKNPVAGCAPVAIAQIANYHRYPAKYKWDNLYEMAVNGICYNLHELFYDIDVYCKTEFKEGKGTTKVSNAAAAISGLGFKSSGVQNPSVSLMSSNISNSNPFFMCADSTYTDKEGKIVGHAWVCDGWQNRMKTAVVSFIHNPKILVDKDKNDPYYDYPIKFAGPNPGLEAGATPTDYFHMNLGWDGESNGWYLFRDIYGGNVANFSKNFKMITASKP